MMKTMIAILIAAAAAVSSASAAPAEALTGKVLSMDGRTKKIELVSGTQEGAAKMSVSVAKLFATKRGHAALDRIDIGDVVRVEVEKDSSGRYEALSIKKPVLSSDAKPGVDKEGQYLKIPQKAVKDPGKRSTVNPLTFEMK